MDHAQRLCAATLIPSLRIAQLTLSACPLRSRACLWPPAPDPRAADRHAPLPLAAAADVAAAPEAGGLRIHRLYRRVGVAQSYIWDAYGATLGIWEFNPAKCTLRDDAPLPLEEVLWLFHHVLKTALYQLKAFELVPANTSVGAPPEGLRSGVTAVLLAAIAFGVYALGVGDDDAAKCIGLVCAFFAPVWLLVWRVGGQFVSRHADRITWGWLAPGITTTLIDCLGQQQGVWRFPQNFLSGIGVGYLKLDVALVYMVSTFAVTASGAVVLAATEELLARRAALGLPTEDANLGDVGKYIFTGELSLGGEEEALEYACTCTAAGCVLPDLDPAAAALELEEQL